MDANATVADARSVGHLFEFRTLEVEAPAPALDEILSAAHDVARHARCREPGTRLFAVLQDRDRPGRILCTAVFDDDAAASAHGRSDAAGRFAAVLLATGARVQTRSWTAVAGI